MDLDPLKVKVLARMRPESLVDDSASWQRRKSGETRIRILESATDCLVERGFARLSINEVTLRAGVSRGAMHHHFPNRLDLVGELIEYLFHQRMRHFLDAYFKVAQRTADFVATATQTHWKSVQTREYAAIVEIAVAARTDAELDSHYLPAARRFDKIWTEEMIRAFPQWERHADVLQKASDFTMAAHMGLLIHRPIFRAGQRSNDVRQLIGDVVQHIYAGAFA
ncbi:MAG: TetR/AcrR family transcriptional regulator [Sphingopyxis sp.]